MGYDVLITKSETGEIRTCHFNEEWLDSTEFIWSEGNYSCDCNREIFFEWIGGNKEAGIGKCGYERFVVKITADGKIVYQDDMD